MNFFDKFITAVSPRRGYEREAWRQALEVLRGYDAAGWQRLNSGWHADNESAEITDRYDRDILRARARDLERNSDIAQSVIHAFKRNVVGKGFKLQAKTGVDELNDQLEALWRQWVKPQNCDVTGMQSFNQHGGCPQKG
jgi:capsid protein